MHSCIKSFIINLWVFIFLLKFKGLFRPIYYIPFETIFRPIMLLMVLALGK